MPTIPLTITSSWTKVADGPTAVLIPAIQRFVFCVTGGISPSVAPAVCPSRDGGEELSLALLAGQSLYVAADQQFVTTWSDVGLGSPFNSGGGGAVGPVATPPSLTGGALQVQGADLVLVPPTVSVGNPAPDLTLTSLTRNGTDVRGLIVSGRITDAAPGLYVAVWTATNSVLPNATASAQFEMLSVEEPVVSSATIVGGSGPTGTLTANIVSQGNPAPNIDLIQWQDGGVDIPGATGISFQKDGQVAAGDVIGFRYVVSNGVGNEVSGASQNTVTITALPSLTASISPNPPVAGQPVTLTFNALPDNVPSVSHGPTALTVTRVGTSLAYATSPLGPNDALSLVAGAGKADYKNFSATYDVVPAPPSLVVTPAQEIELRSLSATSGPVTVTITHPAAYAGTHTIAWADIATAPHWVVAPKATEAAGVLTMTPGLPAWDDTAGPTLTRTRQWLRGTAPGTATPIGNATGLTYTVVPASDGGQTIYPSETVTDGLERSKTVIGTGIAVAAASSAVADTFTAPNGTKSRVYVGESGIAWEDKAGMLLADGKLCPDGGTSWVSHKRLDPPDPLRPVEVLFDNRNNSSAGVWPALRISDDGLSYIHMEPFGNSFRLKRVGASAAVLATWTDGFLQAGATPRIRIVPDPNGTTIRVYFDGVLRMTATDTVLTTGRVGAASYSHSGAGSAAVNGFLDFKGA